MGLPGLLKPTEIDLQAPATVALATEEVANQDSCNFHGYSWKTHKVHSVPRSNNPVEILVYFPLPSSSFLPQAELPRTQSTCSTFFCWPFFARRLLCFSAMH